MPRTPPTALALADFRAQIAAGADTGGRCREYDYATRRGLRGVTWEQGQPPGRFWRIHTTLDSAGAPRRYYEDRYEGADGRTQIHLDFLGGFGSAENSIPGKPAQTAVDRVDVLYHAPNLDDPAARIARILERCRASLDPWGVLARLPDSLRPPPAPRPGPRNPELHREFRRDERGVAYLKASDGSHEGVGWLRMVVIPLYRAPGHDPEAWLARGWVVRPVGSEARWTALTVAGWLFHSYELGSLAVVERHDGWFRFRYAAPDSSGNGTAWAHVSHLSLSDVDLKIVGWEEHFIGGGSTYFTAPGMHVLRAAPSDDSPALDSLPPRDRVTGQIDYSLSVLEARGDWMRVQVHRPGQYCGSTPLRTSEGWIRWRDGVRGSVLQPYNTC